MFLYVCLRRQARSTGSSVDAHLSVRLRWTWIIMNWFAWFLAILHSLPFSFLNQFIMSNV